MRRHDLTKKDLPVPTCLPTYLHPFIREHHSRACLSMTFSFLMYCILGRGPKRQNAKNVTELIFFTVFIHINDLEKVWKSRNEFKVVGFKVEKNGPCSRENEVKIFKKRKMAKNDFSRSDLVSWDVFWGFWGLVCIEKWSQNFDSDTRSAISGTPKMTKTGSF